jgi:hypothetical protein
MQFFGDSYDVVKRFLLRSVAPHAEWAAFPMFSHEVTAQDISSFEAFLGVRVVSPVALTVSTNRADYFAAMAHHRHIFLDPDTGIKLNPSTRADSIKYVFGPELETLCRESNQRLLLVFDQSVPRGGERKAIARKLAHFNERGIVGFAYLSHACFVVLSDSESACHAARASLLASGLPNSRLVPDAQQIVAADPRKRASPVRSVD